MSKKTYDVAIVGTGPAGMFAALRLLEQRPTTSIIMFEKGRDRRQQNGGIVDVTAGWGGAGACSDGKYNLDETGLVGGRLVTDGLVALAEYNRLLHEAAGLYVHFGGDSDRMYGLRTTDDPQEDRRRAQQVRHLQQRAMQHRMRLHTFPILHLGTTTARVIVDNIRAHLEERGVEIHTDCMVRDMVDETTHWLVQTAGGDFNAKYVIVAPGRSGAIWFQEFAQRHGVELHNAGVDIGVRVECAQEVMSPLTDLLYEVKVYFLGQSNDDRWRTFCMCPNGHVAVEHYQDTGILCANGHTDPANPSSNCNFAVLGTQVFTRPFKDPLRYGQWIAELHQMLSGGNSVLVQRLGDLELDRRSTMERMEGSRLMFEPTALIHDGLDPEVRGAVPGDIRCAMPGRFTLGLRRFFAAFAQIAPGINLPDTLLYAPEIKLHSSMAKADPRSGFQIMRNVCVAGDGVGHTRGLNGASIHGMLVAEWMAQQLG